MENLDITEELRAWSGLLGSWRTLVIAPDRAWEITCGGGARYVLKRIGSGYADPVRRVVDEARILSYLAQRGLPVAVPLPRDDGSIVSLAGGAIHTLTPLLPAGRQLRKSPADEEARCFNIGAAMARMHRALADCPYAIESERIGPPGLGPETRRLLETGLAPDVFTDLVSRLEPWESRIDAALDDPHPQRVHGDMHGGNILIDDDLRVSGIIDVDHLPIAPRIYDLGYHQMFSIEWAYQHDHTADAIETATIRTTRRLLGGYQSVSPLTDREIDALPAMTLATAVGLIRWFLKTRGSVRDTWINTAQWITGHAEALLPSS